MRFFVEKILKLGLGWNERQLNEFDLDRLCRRFDVAVQEIPLITDGFYYRVLGKDCIVVNSRLGRVQKLAVLFHEIGHFLFHSPGSGSAAGFHGVGRRTRKECEADIFALCALIPTPWIASRSVDELVEEGFTAEFIAQRHEIYRRYRI